MPDLVHLYFVFSINSTLWRQIHLKHPLVINRRGSRGGEPEEEGAEDQHERDAVHGALQRPRPRRLPPPRRRLRVARRQPHSFDLSAAAAAALRRHARPARRPPHHPRLGASCPRRPINSAGRRGEATATRKSATLRCAARVPATTSSSPSSSPPPPPPRWRRLLDASLTGSANYPLLPLDGPHISPTDIEPNKDHVLWA